MASALQIIQDNWSALGYKRDMERTPAWVPPWVGSHWRRITAYTLLQAIFQNRARGHLAIDDDATKRKHREYGDASLLVNVVRSAITGDDISIVIEGAEEEDEVAQARLEELETWARDERLRAKVLETERDAVRLGDGVYVVHADAKRKRVHLRTYDPGWYFPVLDSSAAEDEFPTTVHIAWEKEEETEPGKLEVMVHRITFELGPIEPASSEGLIRRRETLRPGDERTPTGITRVYKWSDEPSDVTCYMTDGWWRLNDIPPNATLDTPKAWGPAFRYETDSAGRVLDRLDMEIDFLPVIHIPNTVAIKPHYGESVLTAVAQALDELAAADTDAAMAATLAGLPMVGASGTDMAETKVEAGTVIGLGPNGKLDVLDLSKSLEAVMSYIESLLDRITVNSRVTSEALGRVKASEVPSGIALALSFGPMRSLITELRMVREEKYPILLRFVQRIAISQGWWSGEVQPATIAFGPYLPPDRAAVIKETTDLYNAGLSSRETALKVLVDAGIFDVDISEELKACEREDFEAALNLLEALGAGDEAIDEVWKVLGRTRPERPEPEPVQVVSRVPVGAMPAQNGRAEPS